MGSMSLTDPDYEDGLADESGHSPFLDPEAEEPTRQVTAYTRTVNPYKSASDEAWHEYFQGIVAKREAKDIAIENAPATVTGHEWVDDISGWPTSPKRLEARLRANGWQIQAQVSTTHHPEQYYTGRGEITDDGTRSHERGDVKTESFDLTHFGLGCMLESSQKYFQAYWDQKNGKTVFQLAKFDGCYGRMVPGKDGKEVFKTWLMADLERYIND